jgi:hypothetical protein
MALAWSAIAANQCPTKEEAYGCPFPIKGGSGNLPFNAFCIQKFEILDKFSVKPEPMSAFTSNQLVPKSYWEILGSYAYEFGDLGDSDVGCHPVYVVQTLYALQNPLQNNVVLFTDTGATQVFQGGNFYYGCINPTEQGKSFAINDSGQIGGIITCGTAPFFFYYFSQNTTDPNIGCGAISLQNIFYAKVHPLIVGTQMYTDEGCFNAWNSAGVANQWFGIDANLGQSYQVNASGQIIAINVCS